MAPNLICYADSESLLIPNDDNTQGILNTHKMISFTYVILNGITGQLLTYNLLFGNNVSQQVVPTLRKEYAKYNSEFLKN